MPSMQSEEPAVFKPLDPEVQSLYDSLMQHAENCQRDIETHELNLMIHIAMAGNACAGMRKMGEHLLAQSRAMEQEARDMAYLLLK